MSDLPTPRLEMLWRKPTKREMKAGHRADWYCEYSLVLPLRESDIRRTKTRDFMKLKLGGTRCTTSAEKMEHAPFRDGVHAFWDSEALGNLPIFVIGSDGVARPHLRREQIEQMAALNIQQRANEP